MSVTVTDVESFLGTLRNMRGVHAVSRDGNNLSVELDGTRQPDKIKDEILRIYESRAKVLSALVRSLTAKAPHTR